MTTAQAGKKWGISANRVFILARGNRIPGAVKLGNSWMIPADAEKPADGRTKVARSVSVTEEDFFRYPSFAGRDPGSFSPPLSPDELRIKNVLEAFYACRYEAAEELLGDFAEKAENRYIRIAALYEGCMTSIMLCRIDLFLDRYGRLSAELQKDFPRRIEMQEYIREIEATLGANDYYAERFRVDPEYAYHESFLPHLCSLSAVSLWFSEKQPTTESLNAHELNGCSMDRAGCYAEAQAFHLYLGSVYALLGKNREMTLHLRKALRLAEKHGLYYDVAGQYYYLKKQFRPALSDFSPEFRKRIGAMSEDIHARYLRFMDALSANNIYRLLDKDYIYLFYAVQGLTNEEVARLLGLSKGSVEKHYSAIYSSLGLRNKRELTELYQKWYGRAL